MPTLQVVLVGSLCVFLVFVLMTNWKYHEHHSVKDDHKEGILSYAQYHALRPDLVQPPPPVHEVVPTVTIYPREWSRDKDMKGKEDTEVKKVKKAKKVKKDKGAKEDKKFKKVKKVKKDKKDKKDKNFKKFKRDEHSHTRESEERPRWVNSREKSETLKGLQVTPKMNSSSTAAKAKIARTARSKEFTPGMDLAYVVAQLDKEGKSRKHVTLTAARKVSIALVALCRASASFDKWLAYYMEILQLDLLILRVEDCPHCKRLINAYGDRILAIYSSGTSGTADPNSMHANFNDTHHSVNNNYHTMMSRQKDVVNGALDLCAERGIDFLLHSDTDELLYVQPNPERELKVPSSLQLRVILYQLPAKFDNLHLDNYEALYPRFNHHDSHECFETERYVRCKEGGCVAFTNGKSIARVKGRGWRGKGPVRAHGPHWFSGLSYDYSRIRPINPELAVLHFDSCTYKEWETKYSLLKHVNETTLLKIPFRFYKKSIALQHFKDQSKNVTLSAEQRNNILFEYSLKSKNFYNSNKVATYYSRAYYYFQWKNQSYGHPPNDTVITSSVTHFGRRNETKLSGSRRKAVKYDSQLFT